MKTKSLLLALVCVILCAFTSAAAEPYAVFTSSDHTLTFYYGTKPNGAYSLNTGNNYPEWYDNGNFAVATRIVFDPSFAQVRPTTTAYWFYKMNDLTTITGLNYLNTSEVTNMEFMFCNCSKLSTLDLSSFNTSKVTDMNRMFYGCSKLTNINLSSFNTSKVTSMGYMFYDCENLTTLDVSKFNTSNVTNMGGMFYDCKNLLNLDVSHFNTSQVTSMGSMFCNCSSLTTLDVSNFNTQNVNDMGFMFTNVKVPSLDVSKFNTSNVTAMNSMFVGCSNLTTLDLSSFNTSKVTSMSWMFEKCGNLQTILVSDSWSTAAVTMSTQMFQYCYKLVGGAGTTYDSSHTNASYAHIDGGPSNPGYLTAKNAVVNYDLWICGVQVTSANMNGVTGTGISGTVTYNPSTHTLTLNNATLDIINQSVNAINTAYGAPANLKINLVGTNKILARSQQIAINIKESQGFTLCGSGTLNCGAALFLDAGNSLINDVTMSYIKDCSVHINDILSEDYEECLTIDNADVTTEYLNVGSDHNGYEGLKLNNCYIAKPEGGYVENGCVYVANYNGWWDGHVEIKRGSAPGVLGDLDGSGIVDVEDVNAAINIILKLNTMSDYPGNGDMDNNGMIDVEDVNAMINIILKL